MRDGGKKELIVRLPEDGVERISLGLVMVNGEQGMVDIFGAIDTDGKPFYIPRIYSVWDKLTLSLEAMDRIKDRKMGEDEKKLLMNLGEMGWPPLLAVHLVFNCGGNLGEFLGKKVNTTLVAVSGEKGVGKSSSAAKIACERDEVGVINVDVFSSFGAEEYLANLKGETFDKRIKQNSLRGVLDRLVTMVARGDKEIILLDIPGTDRARPRPEDVFDWVTDYSVTGVRCYWPLEGTREEKIGVGVESIESQLGAAVARSKIEDKMFFEGVLRVLC